MSFLEVLDMLNERLIERGEVPVAFDHDCREGICGSCGMMIDGVAHGPSAARPRVSSYCATSGRERRSRRAVARPEHSP